jgi:hypothetical protein
MRRLADGAAPHRERRSMDMSANNLNSKKELEVESLTGALLSALQQKPAQTVTELKAAIDRSFRGHVPLTYVCVALCRLVNDGCVRLKAGRCSSTC